MEPDVLLVRSVYSGISVVARALLNYRVYGCVDVAGKRNSLLKIPTIASKVLLPDNHDVVCRGVRFPHSINGCRLVELTTKHELFTSWISPFRTGGAGKPTLEGVAVTDHREEIRVTSGIAGLDELRSVIGSALAVLVEDEPVALGSTDRELHIAGDGNLSPVGEKRLGSSASRVNNVAKAIGSMPALEVVGVVSGVALVDAIGSVGLARRNLNDLGTNRDACTVDIRHGVLLEHGGVVDDFAVSSA